MVTESESWMYMAMLTTLCGCVIWLIQNSARRSRLQLHRYRLNNVEQSNKIDDVSMEISGAKSTLKVVAILIAPMVAGHSIFFALTLISHYIDNMQAMGIQIGPWAELTVVFVCIAAVALAVFVAAKLAQRGS